jgi:predicted ATPase/DNA-binding winged helix-turn-helix (wHTH) protein
MQAEGRDASTGSPPADGADAYVFGPYRLLMRRRELIAHGVPITLGQRALDILVALVRRQGQLVTKNELMNEVWPGIIVEENNLQVHISALRKALGDDKGERRYLVTVAGRGYRFVHPIEREPAFVPPFVPGSESEPTAARAVWGKQHNVPQALSPLIGRESEIETIRSRLADHRLVTLVGAGGVGKTRLALAVGADALSSHPDGVWLIELASVTDPRTVDGIIADTIGASSGGRDGALDALTVQLEGKAVLLILDNCEHLVAEVARLAEALVHRCRHLSILATSREPLGVAGESVVRVPSLSAPAADAELTADQALDYPAVRLLIERAKAVVPGFAVTAANAGAIGAVCRRLDGIPMAMELAAPRLKVLSVEQLLRGLDDRFHLLTGGSRSALPRHQTLHALIDWSHGLLADAEKTLLRRLSVFAGSASFASVAAVAADGGGPEHALLDPLASLVDKSLVLADIGGLEARYRLLESTRDYALAKLEQAGELALRRAHAAHFVTRLAQATEGWETMASEPWLVRYGPDVDNLRAALTWAFGADGDLTLGLELVGFSHLIWAELGFPFEHRRWVEEALARTDATTPATTLARLLSWQAGDVKELDDPTDYKEALRAAALYRDLGDRFHQGQLLLRAGMARLSSDNAAESEQLLNEAHGLLRPSGATKTLARCLSALASARLFADDISAAQGLHQQALAIHHQLGGDGAATP